MKFMEFIKDNLNWKKVNEEYRDEGDDGRDPEPDWLEPDLPAPAPQPAPRKQEDYQRIKKGEEPEKKEKEVKQFNVGDVLKLVDTKRSAKLPADAYEFLMTYKKFTVLKVTPTGKLDLGCRISKNTPEGGVEKFFIFGPNRFELLEPAKSDIKPLEDPDQEPNEDWK